MPTSRPRPSRSCLPQWSSTPGCRPGHRRAEVGLPRGAGDDDAVPAVGQGRRDVGPALRWPAPRGRGRAGVDDDVPGPLARRRQAQVVGRGGPTRPVRQPDPPVDLVLVVDPCRPGGVTRLRAGVRDEPPGPERAEHLVAGRPPPVEVDRDRGRGHPRRQPVGRLLEPVHRDDHVDEAERGEPLPDRRRGGQREARPRPRPPQPPQRRHRAEQVAEPEGPQDEDVVAAHGQDGSVDDGDDQLADLAAGRLAAAP